MLSEFYVTVSCAAAQARESLASLQNVVDPPSTPCLLTSNYAQALANEKPRILALWLRAVKGHVAGPTLFGPEEGWFARYSGLFDALMATLESEQCSDAPLVSFWADAVAGAGTAPCAGPVLQNTVSALLLFKEVACNALNEGSRDATFSGLAVHLERVLCRAEQRLTAAARLASVADNELEAYRALMTSRDTFLEARETLLQTLDAVRSLIPLPPPAESRDLEVLQRAQELKQMAAHIQRFVGELATPGAAKPDLATGREADRQIHDVRVALVQLLRQNEVEISQRWVEAIQRLRKYMELGLEVDANINKELVHSMIECLRPGGDSAGLVYCIQALVERRFKRMQESGGDEFIKAAIHLFQDVCMAIYREAKQLGGYWTSLLPLMSVSSDTVQLLLEQVTHLTARLVRGEYRMHLVHESDPRLPIYLLTPPRDISGEDAVKTYLPSLLVGAEVAGRYRLDAYIMSGGFGHGFRATDLQCGHEVFVKIFKSSAEAPDMRSAKAMVEELETSERLMKVKRLMQHRNIVEVLQVPRSALLQVPTTGQSGHALHGIVTEYCDGGELINYIMRAGPDGGMVGHQFREPQARFLFKQIVDLLMWLHNPAEGPDAAYFHGDLKEQNLVFAGPTLKLIDYGSLTKRMLHTGPASHWTPSYRQPFHNSCEAVDLWAAGVILLNMLVFSAYGAVFRWKPADGRNTGVEDLRSGLLWPKLEGMLKVKDPDNCLLERGPGSAQDLLQRIFVMEPQNSLSIEEVARHPWLQGPVPTEAEMEAELKGRYAGILSGAPRGTVFFNLEQCTEEEGQSIMRRAVELSCQASHGDFVVAEAGPEAEACGSLHIHRWVHPADGAADGASKGPGPILDASDWVAGTYECSVEPGEERGMPTRSLRIRLHWETGSSYDDLYRLSALLLNQIIVLQHHNPTSDPHS